MEVGKSTPTILFQLYAKVRFGFFMRNVKIKLSKLEQVKKSLLRYIQQEMKRSKRCVLMMLSNLAFPQWATVNCTEKRLIDMVCMTQGPNIRLSSLPDSVSCKKGDILQKHVCFTLYYCDNTQSTAVKDFQVLTYIPSLHKEFLFLAIHVRFPPVLMWTKNNKLSVTEILCDRMHQVMRFKLSEKSIKSSKGFFVTQSPATFYKQIRIPVLISNAKMATIYLPFLYVMGLLIVENLT